MDTVGGPTTTNTAEAGSTIGIQAYEVHNSTIYQMLPGASPKEEFELGVRLLDDGVPHQAFEHITDAIGHGLDTAEVRFHWALTLLSKRSYRDLTAEDRNQLAQLPGFLNRYSHDEWRRALAVVHGLLECAINPKTESESVLAELLDLHMLQREKIIRHLELVLSGTVKDRVWSQTCAGADSERFAGDRAGRVWAYFHADPKGPRTRKAAKPATTPRDMGWAYTWSAVFLIAGGAVGWLVLEHPTVLAACCYLLAIAAGYVAARDWLEWHYRTKQLARMERLYAAWPVTGAAPDKGFASRVDRSFSHYMIKYAPKNRDSQAWRSETAGARRMLRNEIVELYRETRVPVERVNWLIGHMVLDLRERWLSGTLWEYRERLETSSVTKVRCSLALVAFAAATVEVFWTAVQAHLVATIAVTVALAGCGRLAARCWTGIVSEKRRYNAEKLEEERISAQRQEAYLRWKKRLDDTRPSEHEMESWLNSDKIAFADNVLTYYRLAWRDILAYALLQTPAKQCKRARVRRGPWRYSGYDLRLFLVTPDGVREVMTELDFKRAEFIGQERHNFRFDAMSSVRVIETSDLSYTLALTLTNGPTRDIQIVDGADQEADPGQSPEAFSRINLDAAGFSHTLHILEGIAAEGKPWIHRAPITVVDDNPGSVKSA